MINSEKIIEMNSGELEQISGGLDAKNKEKLKKIIKVVGTIEIALGGVAGLCLGAVAGKVWIDDAVKSGKDIGSWGRFWRRNLAIQGGAQAGTGVGALLARATHSLGNLIIN